VALDGRAFPLPARLFPRLATGEPEAEEEAPEAVAELFAREQILPCRSTSSAAAGTTGPRGSETGLRSRIRPAVTGEDTRVGLPDLNFDETRLRLESLIRT